MVTTLAQQAVSFLSQFSNLAVIAVCTAIVVYICYNLSKHLRPKTIQTCRHPPCLKSLPIIGSIPYLPGFNHLHHFFLSKLPTLGPVIGFTVLSRYNVILQTREAIVEAFTKTETANRPISFFAEKHFKFPVKGFIFSNYTAEYKKYHQLTLTILKQFGLGTLGGVMESRIHVEVAGTIADLQATGSQPTDPAAVVNVSVVNVIASILLGKRYHRKDPQVQTLIYQNRLFTELLGTKLTPLIVVPALRYVPYFRRALTALEEFYRWYNDMLREKIDECENDVTRTPCFIRSFIEAEGQGRETYDKVELICILQDLFLAGTETSGTTILWSVILLANHRDIQVRLQEEIDSVVPRQRLPSVNDRAQLTFVDAFILELMRYKTIVPLGGPHESSKDTVVQGFFIPANTTVISNLHAVNMDSSVWGDPETFRPDRFIDQKGNIVNRDRMIPFSAGKRSCLGEQLARQEIFLFVTGLLQNFTFLPPEGRDTVEYKEIVGSTVAPTCARVRFVPREIRPN